MIWLHARRIGLELRVRRENHGLITVDPRPPKRGHYSVAPGDWHDVDWRSVPALHRAHVVLPLGGSVLGMLFIPNYCLTPAPDVLQFARFEVFALPSAPPDASVDECALWCVSRGLLFVRPYFDLLRAGSAGVGRPALRGASHDGWILKSSNLQNWRVYRDVMPDIRRESHGTTGPG